jgi:hypothetical protein
MIQFDEVRKSYTGRHGCMCGCKGVYRIPTHYGIEAANNEAGYAAHDRCSDRGVKAALAKVNAGIDWSDEASVQKHLEADNAYVDTETRTAVIYLMPGAYEKIMERVRKLRQLEA